MRSRRARALAALCAGLLVLGACAGEEPEEAAADGDGVDADETETDDGDGGATGEPQDGGRFVFGAFSEIAGLDPVVNTGHAAAGGIPGAALYDTLMRVDADGQVVAHLAESLEPTDEAGQQWELTLREDVEFHDGTPLDGDAVVFNVERHLDPELGSDYIGEVSPIEAMEADSHTVTFALEHPWAAFPAIFTHVVGMIASPTAIEEQGEDFNQAPVGAGPFMFESWRPDDELVLVRNPDYWQEGLPHLDEWVQRPMPDAQTRLTAIQSGEIDATYSPFTGPEITALAQADGIVDQTRFGNNGGGVVMNLQAEHLEDLRVRQAIAHFIDYDGINEVNHDGALPDGERGVFRTDSPWYSGVEFPGTDVETGQQLLDDYLDDVGQDGITLTFGTVPERRPYAELLQQMLTRPGLEIEIEQVDASEYVPSLFSGDYELGMTTYPEPSDPDLHLFRNFHSASPLNMPQAQNPELDAALEQGRMSLDEDERAEAYAEVERIKAEQVPVIYLTPGVQVMLARDHVHGLDMEFDGQFLSDRLWLAD